MTTIETTNDKTIVNGDLSFHTVTALFEQSLETGGSELVIDLKNAGRVDSAGIALLVEWASRSSEQGKAMKLENVPEDAASLIRLGDIENLLGLSQSH